MDELREPRTLLQHLVRSLAEDAMSVTHHDASETEDGYIHEVATMERLFARRIRGYLTARSHQRRRG